MTICIKCSCELTDLSWEPSQKKNWVNKCRDCVKEEKRLYSVEWRKQNPTKATKAQQKYKAKTRLLDPIKARASAAYSDCRKRSIKHGMGFDLTSLFIEELMRKTIVCPYLDIPLSFIQGEKDNSLASVDRIDSTKGYTQDNVQIISYLANLMKSHASVEQLLAFAAGVQKQHTSKE